MGSVRAKRKVIVKVEAPELDVVKSEPSSSGTHTTRAGVLWAYNHYNVVLQKRRIDNAEVHKNVNLSKKIKNEGPQKLQCDGVSTYKPEGKKPQIKTQASKQKTITAPKVPLMQIFNDFDISLQKRKMEELDTADKLPLKHVIKGVDINWTVDELLAEQQGLPVCVSTDIIKLFEDGNTLPFIARYRGHLTQNIPPEGLRQIKENYDEIVHLQTKIKTALKTLEKGNLLNEDVKWKIASSRSLEELEYVYSPFKPGSKRSLAERAKESGLEPAATSLLNYEVINLEQYIGGENLKTTADVETGIMHIISAMIATRPEILTQMREVRKTTNFKIKTKQKPTENVSKFDNYADLEISTNIIKPHQVLAINRGEHLKELLVKVIVPDFMFGKFQKFCSDKWKIDGGSLRKKILVAAIEDAYKRSVQPHLIREIRAELKSKAERASCDVFSTNLKHLLLAKPLKGESILGIDPGFSYGCKFALINSMGELLSYGKIFPHKKNQYQKDLELLKATLLKHKCELIALGNGKGCRETEEYLSRLLTEGAFKPLNVRYTIVSEDGASIYSCSAEAKKEFPDLEPNIISAVSLARRVQEPLAELVKIEPQHIGVGMYQHDLKKKELSECLNDVVSECVSFVGVDLNTTSQCLLKHVAGLSDKKSQKIIDFRTKNGPFHSRKQLLDVAGIGKKVFEQCAGFLRVGPMKNEDFYQDSRTSQFDCTYIHPESYKTASDLLKLFKLRIEDLGTDKFIKTVQTKVKQLDLDEIATKLQCTQETLNLIVDSLSKPLNFDLRSELSTGAVFKKDLTKFDDLKVGMILTGRITNVTHFGCFVDVGLGFDGLIHTSKFYGLNIELGRRIEVKMISLEPARERMGLAALRLL